MTQGFVCCLPFTCECCTSPHVNKLSRLKFINAQLLKTNIDVFIKKCSLTCSFGAAAVTLHKCFQCEYSRTSVAAMTMSLHWREAQVCGVKRPSHYCSKCWTFLNEVSYVYQDFELKKVHFWMVMCTLKECCMCNVNVKNIFLLISLLCVVCRYEYHWADGTNIKKPIKCSAPKYIDYLMTWVQDQLDDETLFPSKIGVLLL